MTSKVFPLGSEGENLKFITNITDAFHEFITIFRVIIGNAKFLTKFVQSINFKRHTPQFCHALLAMTIVPRNDKNDF